MVPLVLYNQVSSSNACASPNGTPQFTALRCGNHQLVVWPLVSLFVIWPIWVAQTHVIQWPTWLALFCVLPLMIVRALCHENG